MSYAPIVLFAYNRPIHMKKTLDALAQNSEATESILYIYCDGPKANCNENLLANINEVRAIADTESRFEKVEVIKREGNYGLAENIRDGVSTVVNLYDNVIVLEDDIVVSKGFLKYMNNALDLYKYDERIMHISGYMYPHSEELPETFFYNVTLCWGWATWNRAWFHFNNDAIHLWQTIESNELWRAFEKFGGERLRSQLADNITGKLNTWFVKWHASVLLNGGYTLFPSKSLVQNIGFDNSGIHTGDQNDYFHAQLAKAIEVEKIELSQNSSGEKAIRSFYQNLNSASQTRLSKSKIKKTFKLFLISVIPSFKKLFEDSVDFIKIRSHLGYNVKLTPKTVLIDSLIGSYTYVSQNATFKNTIVGKFCSIGPNLISGWGVHPTMGISTHPMFYSLNKQNGITLSTENKYRESKLITIGNDVFIGMNVLILDGVTVGHGAIIGAGTVVSKDVPPFAIVVGNPMRIVRYRHSDDTIEALLKINWWDFPPEKLNEVEKYFFDLENFINNNLSE